MRRSSAHRSRREGPAAPRTLSAERPRKAVPSPGEADGDPRSRLDRNLEPGPDPDPGPGPDPDPNGNTGPDPHPDPSPDQPRAHLSQLGSQTPGPGRAPPAQAGGSAGRGSASPPARGFPTATAEKSTAAEPPASPQAASCSACRNAMPPAPAPARAGAHGPDGAPRGTRFLGRPLPGAGAEVPPPGARRGAGQPSAKGRFRGAAGPVTLPSRHWCSRTPVRAGAGGAVETPGGRRGAFQKVPHRKRLPRPEAGCGAETRRTWGPGLRELGNRGRFV